MDIHESDWRVFRRLHSIALERFCTRVLEEVRRPPRVEPTITTVIAKVRVDRNNDKRMAAALTTCVDRTSFYC
jgi:hypothetical protein